MNDETTNPLPNTSVQTILAKADAYKQGAMWGAGIGLLVSLFLVKGKYIMCTVGGGLIGGYLSYRMAETKIATPKITDFAQAPIVQTQEPVAETHYQTLQQDLQNKSADGNQ